MNALKNSLRFTAKMKKNENLTTPDISISTINLYNNFFYKVLCLAHLKYHLCTKRSAGSLYLYISP